MLWYIVIIIPSVLLQRNYFGQKSETSDIIAKNLTSMEEDMSKFFRTLPRDRLNQRIQRIEEEEIAVNQSAFDEAFRLTLRILTRLNRTYSVSECLTKKERRIIITEIIAGVCDYCQCNWKTKLTEDTNAVKENRLGWGTLDFIMAAPNDVIVKESMFDEDDEIRVTEALEAAKEMNTKYMTDKEEQWRRELEAKASRKIQGIGQLGAQLYDHALLLRSKGNNQPTIEVRGVLSTGRTWILFAALSSSGSADLEILWRRIFAHYPWIRNEVGHQKRGKKTEWNL
jgi:hypothetical protein